MTHKTCTKCGQTKSLAEYSKSGRGRGGRRAVCKMCVAVYRAANRTGIAAYRAAYDEANREKVAAYSAAYRKANRDKVAHKDAVYHKANPHTGWAARYRHRCREFGLIPVVEPFTRDDVVSRYGDTCYYCADGPFEHLDHHVPVAAGGAHTIENVRPACAPCNLRKRNSTDQELINSKRGT